MSCAIQIPCNPPSFVGGSCWYYPPENCSYTGPIPTEVMPSLLGTLLLVIIAAFIIYLILKHPEWFQGGDNGQGKTGTRKGAPA